MDGKKDAFENGVNKIDYTSLLYEENPDYGNMMKDLLKMDSSVDEVHFQDVINSMMNNGINDYPPDKKLSFRQYLNSNLNEKVLKRIILNTILHYYTRDEFNVYYQFRITEASRKLGIFSKTQNLDEIARSIK